MPLLARMLAAPLTVLRERSASGLRAWLAGFAEGWRMDAGGGILCRPALRGA